MLHSIKIKQLAIPVLFAAGVIFNSCVGSKHIQTDKVLVKWEVEFKPGLSQEEKAKAFQELDREIINYVYETNSMPDTAAPAPAPPNSQPNLSPNGVSLDNPCYNTFIGHTPDAGSPNKTTITAGLDPCGRKIAPGRTKPIKLGPVILPVPLRNVLNIISVNPAQH